MNLLALTMSLVPPPKMSLLTFTQSKVSSHKPHQLSSASSTTKNDRNGIELKTAHAWTSF